MTPRLATAEDQLALDALYEETRRPDFEAMGLPAPMVAVLLGQQARARRQMFGELRKPREWLLEDAQRPVAVLVLAEAPGGTQLVDVRVAPARRGEGLGNVLLRLALREADEAGLALSLRVEHGNPARAWYLRHGFAPSGDAGELDQVLRRSPGGR